MKSDTGYIASFFGTCVHVWQPVDFFEFHVCVLHFEFGQLPLIWSCVCYFACILFRKITLQLLVAPCFLWCCFVNSLYVPAQRALASKAYCLLVFVIYLFYSIMWFFSSVWILSSLVGFWLSLMNASLLKCSVKVSVAVQMFFLVSFHFSFLVCVFLNHMYFFCLLW